MLLLAIWSLAIAESPCIGDRNDIIITGFHWNIVKPVTVKNEATSITEYTGGTEKPGTWYKKLLLQAQNGDFDAFSTIYLPPPWKESQSYKTTLPTGQEVLGGGEGYYSHDFDLNSNYGSKTDLIALCTFLKSKNKHIVFDIVPNHRDHKYMENNVWNYTTSKNWRKNNPQGDSGGAFLGGEADLSTLEPEVFNRIADAMNELMHD